MSEQLIEAMRLGWFAVFLILTPVAGWNLYQSLLDLWASSPERRLAKHLPTIEALQHEARGSAIVQLCAFVGLLSGLGAGISSLAMIPLGALLGIIFIGMSLGALTICEAARRLKVSRALRRRSK